MNETDIRGFWQGNPCGDNLLSLRDYSAYDQFFTAYDTYKYELEDHIPGCLDELRLDGVKLLEVGLGQGAESEQLIRRGARWTGLDLTDEAVARVRTRLTTRALPFDDVVRGSITDAPFADDTFDMVFSHGVLHHVPDVQSAQREIHRILKPNGRLVIMMYAKYSLNYLVAIAVARRLGLLGMYLTGIRPSNQVYRQHLDNARKVGLWKYLRLSNFIHHNTDGPMNPYAKVYGRTEIEKDFPAFRIERMHKHFMHAPPLPVRWMPLAGVLGWHLWAELSAK